VLGRDSASGAHPAFCTEQRDILPAAFGLVRSSIQLIFSGVNGSCPTTAGVPAVAGGRGMP